MSRHIFTLCNSRNFNYSNFLFCSKLNLPYEYFHCHQGSFLPSACCESLRLSNTSLAFIFCVKTKCVARSQTPRIFLFKNKERRRRICRNKRPKTIDLRRQFSIETSGLHATHLLRVDRPTENIDSTADSSRLEACV